MTQPAICVSISSERWDTALEAALDAAGEADLVEIRFDALQDHEQHKLADELILRGVAKRSIATYRPISEGGLSADDAVARRQFFQKYASAFWAVDVEPEMLPAVRAAQQKIVSWHNFQPSAEIDVVGKFDELAGFGPDIVKVAVGATDAADAVEVWSLIRKAKTADVRVIAIAVGAAGVWTRILGSSHGAALTYASLRKGSETADGQPTAIELIENYNFRHLSERTKVYGVIGDPVSQSLSPAIHNAAFRKAGIDAVFLPFLVRDIGRFIKEVVRSGDTDIDFGGFAVTMPHKLSIMGHLDEIDAGARSIGAVNTVSIDAQGSLRGGNTDADGFIKTFESNFGAARGMKVAIVGSGGAARACAYALDRSGAEVVVLSRSPDASRDLPGRPKIFDVNSTDLRCFDAMVNATPLGMLHLSDDKMLFSPQRLRGVKYIYDLIVSPKNTALMENAIAVGAEAVSGLEMLVEQAALQFETWTGLEADRESMAAAARLELVERI